MEILKIVALTMMELSEKENILLTINKINEFKQLLKNKNCREKAIYILNNNYTINQRKQIVLYTDSLRRTCLFFWACLKIENDLIDFCIEKCNVTLETTTQVLGLASLVMCNHCFQRKTIPYNDFFFRTRRNNTINVYYF